MQRNSKLTIKVNVINEFASIFIDDGNGIPEDKLNTYFIVSLRYLPMTMDLH